MYIQSVDTKTKLVLTELLNSVYKECSPYIDAGCYYSNIYHLESVSALHNTELASL